MNNLILRPPQIPMVDWVRTHERCALWAGMGIGKTSAELYALVLMDLMGEISGDPTLVVGPMRVARDTWPDEIKKWTQFSHLNITALTGTPKERLQKLKQSSSIFTISYELLPWLVETLMERWPFRQVIADESDRLKGFREKKGGVSLTKKKAGHAGKRAHAIGRVAHTLTKRWVNLTGTPSPKDLTDLWGQTWYIDRGQRLGRTYSAFLQRWFRPTWDGNGIEALPHAEKEIHAALHDICLTVDPKDYFDLDEPVVTPIKVKLPPAVRKIYKQLEKDLFAELGDLENVEVFNAAALTNKCLQLANGFVYTQYPSWKPMHTEKLDALESIQHESGGTPLLVAYTFKPDVAMLKRAFPKAVELSTPAGMAAFKAGDAPMGLAHPKSMGHGIDGLQDVTNILVRYGHTWNYGETLQMMERIGPMRQFQSFGADAKPVLVYDLIAEDTTDEDVLASHVSKCSVQTALLAAMKRRK